MAKAKQQSQEAAKAEAKQDAKQQSQEAAKAEAKQAKAVPWTVSCDCPTPLAHNPCTVMAANETEAKQRFCAKNGIAGTDHPVTAEPKTDEK